MYFKLKVKHTVTHLRSCLEQRLFENVWGFFILLGDTRWLVFVTSDTYGQKLNK